jgi:hypothetical protein
MTTAIDTQLLDRLDLTAAIEAGETANAVVPVTRPKEWLAQFVAALRSPFRGQLRLVDRSPR